jgi:hypothetical protein
LADPPEAQAQINTGALTNLVGNVFALAVLSPTSFPRTTMLDPFITIAGTSPVLNAFVSNGAPGLLPGQSGVNGGILIGSGGDGANGALDPSLGPAPTAAWAALVAGRKPRGRRG